MVYTLDCEFNGYKGDLLSIALVSEDFDIETKRENEALYIVVEKPDSFEYDPWVAENVVPILKHPTSPFVVLPLEEIPTALETFFYKQADTGSFSKPTIISDWPDDIKYFSELLLTGPGTMIDLGRVGFQVMRVDAYPTDISEAIQHNAYWDAIALKYKIEKKHNLSLGSFRLHDPWSR